MHRAPPTNHGPSASSSMSCWMQSDSHRSMCWVDWSETLTKFYPNPSQHVDVDWGNIQTRPQSWHLTEERQAWYSNRYFTNSGRSNSLTCLYASKIHTINICVERHHALDITFPRGRRKPQLKKLVCLCTSAYTSCDLTAPRVIQKPDKN